MSAPGKGDDQDTIRMAERIKQLAVDGYLRWDNGHWLLTRKGWNVLFAEAEPAMYKPKGKSP